MSNDDTPHQTVLRAFFASRAELSVAVESVAASMRYLREASHHWKDHEDEIPASDDVENALAEIGKAQAGIEQARDKARKLWEYLQPDLDTPW